LNVEGDDYSDTGEGVLFDWCVDYYNVSDSEYHMIEWGASYEEGDGTENPWLMTTLRRDILTLWADKVYADANATDITGVSEDYESLFTGYLYAKENDSDASSPPWN